MLAHVRTQHHLDDQLPHSFVLIRRKGVEHPHVLRMMHDVESKCDVVVLKNADVVVAKCHFVTGVDEEDVAEPGVVGVVDGAGEVHAAAVEGGELAEGFELADFEEVEGGLGDVGCVGFVVIGDLVVVALNC